MSSEYFWYAVIAVIVVFIAPAIGGHFSALAFQNKFADLGDVPGKTLAEITDAVGGANATFAGEQGNTYVWDFQSGYSRAQISITFDENGVALGYAGSQNLRP